VVALRQAQQSFDFSTPGDHAEKVHTGTRHGTVLFWENGGTSHRWVKCRPDDDLPGIANELRGTRDSYFTVNQFNGWREVRLLRSLRAVYIDLDDQLDLDLALDALASARMPAPSFVVWSGRGLHLYWLIEPVPAKALPVWQRIQDTLLRTLRNIGADPACRDCTRVLRLAGTVNSKNDAETRGLILTGTKWDLHTLADEVLGHRQPKPTAQVRDLNAASARKGTRRTQLAGSIYGWWHAVYTDLVKLTDLRFHNKLPDGHRDKWLFLHAVALSWFAQPDAITDEVLQVGRLITDFSDSEILKIMSPVIQRRNDADAGHKITFAGKERDPRYFFKAETLRDWIGRDLIESHADKLRALAPAEVIKERKAERDKGRWSDHYTGAGVRASNEQNRASARLMAAQGVRQQDIATELGVSQQSVSRWLKSS
jgi:hypothetical protein